jgi:hypothetical protein
LFKSVLPEEDQSVKAQKLFVEILKRRLLNENKLSQQLREKL